MLNLFEQLWFLATSTVICQGWREGSLFLRQGQGCHASVIQLVETLCLSGSFGIQSRSCWTINCRRWWEEGWKTKVKSDLCPNLKSFRAYDCKEMNARYSINFRFIGKRNKYKRQKSVWVWQSSSKLAILWNLKKKEDRAESVLIWTPRAEKLFSKHWKVG